MQRPQATEASIVALYFKQKKYCRANYLARQPNYTRVAIHSVIIPVLKFNEALAIVPASVSYARYRQSNEALAIIPVTVFHIKQLNLNSMKLSPLSLTVLLING